MNTLTTYKPTITSLNKNTQKTYMKVATEQFTPELMELIVDITVQFDSEILSSLEGTDRAELYNKLCSILDGNIA